MSFTKISNGVRRFLEIIPKSSENICQTRLRLLPELLFQIPSPDTKDLRDLGIDLLYILICF